jgi:hydrogenase maturation protease
MANTLVIGYGNIHRQDDGVAFAVVNALRCYLGQVLLDAAETGLEQLGSPLADADPASVRAAFVLQLAPELLDLAADYDRLVFVDAHVHPEVDGLHSQVARPEYGAAAFTHHMTPGMFLALLEALYHRRPESQVVSVRGHCFDFQVGLSAATAALVQPAVEQILRIIGAPQRALGRVDTKGVELQEAEQGIDQDFEERDPLALDARVRERRGTCLQVS